MGLHILRYYWADLRVILKQPRHVISICRFLLQYALNKFLTKRLNNYPKSVLSAVNSLQPHKHIETRFSYTKLNLVSLTLASGKYSIDVRDGWQRQFEDGEDQEALHRWNWLLKDQMAFDFGINLLIGWCHEMTHVEDGLHIQSYTIAERLSSLSIFCQQHDRCWNDVPHALQVETNKMSLQLAGKLEYFSLGMTGNHVINNARGLILFGEFSNNPKLIKVGLRILEESLRPLLTDDGFLREGSSHYHFLLLSWVIDCRFCVHDQNTTYFLDNVLELMVNVAEILIFQNRDGEIDIPLIGDISPDVAPRSLLNRIKQLTSVNLAGGSLPLETLGQLLRRPQRRACSFRHLEYSGVVRIDWMDWTLFLHLTDGGGEPEASHAHQDFCAPVLYYNGEAVLTDPGRSRYTNEPSERLYTEGALGHSSILIDGCGPGLTRRDKLVPASYRGFSARLNFEQSEQEVMISITHDGYSRISSSLVSHTRTITILKHKVKIRDVIEGKGKFDFSARYVHGSLKPKHIYAKLSQESKPAIEVVPKKVRSKLSKEYGQNEESLSSQLSFSGILPVELNVTFDME